MAAELAAGQRPRIAEPAVEKEYSVEAVTARIDDLYERLAARGAWRTIVAAERRARGERDEVFRHRARPGSSART